MFIHAYIAAQYKSNATKHIQIQYKYDYKYIYNSIALALQSIA